MELDCGGVKGGWMRIADFRKGDACPSGWTRYNSNHCTGGSAAGYYSTHSTRSNKVCGKVVGYQKGTIYGWLFPICMCTWKS